MLSSLEMQIGQAVYLLSVAGVSYLAVCLVFLCQSLVLAPAIANQAADLTWYIFLRNDPLRINSRIESD